MSAGMMVYSSGTHRKSCRPVAIKVINKKRFPSKQERQMRNEALILEVATSSDEKTQHILDSLDLLAISFCICPLGPESLPPGCGSAGGDVWNTWARLCGHGEATWGHVGDDLIQWDGPTAWTQHSLYGRTGGSQSAMSRHNRLRFIVVCITFISHFLVYQS